MNDNMTFTPKNLISDNMMLTSITPTYRMTFYRDNIEIVGTLDFSGPEMIFEGNATESAKIFFDWIAKALHGRLVEERERCAKLCEDAGEYASFVDLANTIRKLE